MEQLWKDIENHEIEFTALKSLSKKYLFVSSYALRKKWKMEKLHWN